MIETMLFLLLNSGPIVERPVFRPEDLTMIRAGHEMTRAKANAGRDLAPPADELKTKGLHHGTASVLRRN
jgi:hypothetical protein